MTEDEVAARHLSGRWPLLLHREWEQANYYLRLGYQEGLKEAHRGSDIASV